jgi:hypothetical protein
MQSLLNRSIINRITFPLGVLVVLALSYLLDKWLFTQTRLAHSNPASTWYQDPIFVWTFVSGIILFAAWLGLGWIVLARSQRSLPISIIILIVGLIIYLYPFLQMIFTWLPYIFTNVRTPLSYSGLYIAILSILQLLIKQPNKTMN